MRLWRILLAIVTVLSFGLAISPASSLRAQDYPSRTVTIVNPFAPGGGTDLLARLVGQKLEQRLGQSFVIENKTGAGSIIAAVAVQKAAPDGYTLLMATNSPLSAAPTLNKTINYDPVKDFAPLSRIGSYIFILAVHPDVPAQSLPELIAYAKANPNKLSFASGLCHR